MVSGGRVRPLEARLSQRAARAACAHHQRVDRPSHQSPSTLPPGRDQTYTGFLTRPECPEKFLGRLRASGVIVVCAGGGGCWVLEMAVANALERGSMQVPRSLVRSPTGLHVGSPIALRERKCRLRDRTGRRKQRLVQCGAPIPRECIHKFIMHALKFVHSLKS